MKNLAARLIEMDKEETQLRDSLLGVAPFFANELSPLTTLHARLSAELKEIYLAQGWPTIAAVGWDAAHAAARVSRHCISEPDFMHGCLPVVEQSCRFGEIGGDWFAELYDALMFYENKPQVFGTFVTWNQELKAAPWTLVEPEHANARREAFGLPPMDQKSPDSLANFESRYQRPENYEEYRAGLETWARARGWNRLA